MRAIVLVGGEGTRLRPLTYSRPKQMLPIVGITMIERVLGSLATHGVNEAVLSLGYQPRAFLEAFPEGVVCGVNITYAVESSPLDTAGAIKFAATQGGYDRADEPFLVVNGDVLSGIDLAQLVAFHEQNDAAASLALTQVDDPSRFGVVATADNGRVLGFIEKPPPGEATTNWINAGHYVIEPSVLDRIAEDQKVSIERETFPLLVADGTLFALHSPAYWIDAGTPQTYLQAQLDLLAGENWIDPSADVHPSATVECSAIGPNSVIGAHAAVRRSVLLAGAEVEEGAVVDESVLGASARVGQRASLTERSVVGDHGRVEPDARLVGARVGGPRHVS